MGPETIPRHFCTVGSFQSGGAFTSWKALTIESLVMSGCDQSCERWLKEALAQVLTPSRSGGMN